MCRRIRQYVSKRIEYNEDVFVVTDHGVKSKTSSFPVNELVLIVDHTVHRVVAFFSDSVHKPICQTMRKRSKEILYIFDLWILKKIKLPGHISLDML